MKKSKIILALALAIMIIVTSISVPTFSWFTRPQNLSGEKMLLQSKNAYTAYNGKSVTISTKSSSTGITSPDSYTDTSSSLSGSGIATYHRKYFCTTITNSSSSEQNVSLYARTLSIPTSNNGTLALGVNDPTRSYRDYSALAAQKTYYNQDSMRIYFQKPKTAPDGWSGTDFYICWNEDTNTGIESLDSTGSNGTYYKMTYCGEKDNYYNYYVDIPKTATHAFFACENWAENKKVEDLTADHWKKRTQTLWDLHGDGQSQLQSKVYQLTNTVTNGNTTVHTPPYSVTGNCINHYYDTIYVAVGNTFNAALTNTTNIPTRDGYSANYIGGSLEYYSSDENVFEIVDKNGNKTATGGYIKPIAAGEATLYTKSVGGSYPDSQQVETTVKVTAAANYVFNDVPIVRNIKLAADESVDVYWYVMNNSTTNALTYTIDEVYVGL